MFQSRLRNILMCYAVGDRKVGYVQGMNLVLSGILYHIKDEIKAYAVFRSLTYSMRGVFLNSSCPLTQTSRSATDISPSCAPTSLPMSTIWPSACSRSVLTSI